MGRVLPRENSWVEAVPCRILTQSTGSRCGWIRCRLVCSISVHALGEYGADCSEAGCFEECAPAWALRAIFRHVDQRCLSEVNLYQDRLIGRV